MQHLFDDGNRILWPFDGPVNIGKYFFTQDSSGFIQQTETYHTLHNIHSTVNIRIFTKFFLKHNCDYSTRSSIIFVCECVEKYSTLEGVNVRMA